MTMQEVYYKQYTELSGQANRLRKYRVKEPLGSGEIVQCFLGTGVELGFYSYSTSPQNQISSFGTQSQNTLELFYCLQGTIRTEYPGFTTCLQPNMVGIYDFNNLPIEVVFEDEQVKGISLLMDCDRADEMISAYLGNGVMTVREMMQLLKSNDRSFRINCESNMTDVYLSIARNPFAYHIDYLRLKAMELILVVSEGMRAGLGSEQRCNAADRRTLWRIKEYVHSHLAEDLSVQAIADGVGGKPGQIKRLIQLCYGKTLHAYVKEERLLYAGQLLLETDAAVTEIAADVGWQNTSKFSAAFKERYGVVPSVFRIKE